MTVMPWELDKLSEKTLDLNLASQLNHRCGGKLLWFGLTQQQEARAGYDIATCIGQALFVVQMKASNLLLKTKERKPGASGKAVFHSEPVTVIPQRGDAFASDLIESKLGNGLLAVMTNDNFRDFWELCELFHRKAFGVVFVK